MLSVNFTNWKKARPDMDRALQAAFMKAFTSYPDDKKPTIDEILVEAMKKEPWTMEMMVEALKRFGGDTAEIEALLLEKKKTVVTPEPVQKVVPETPHVDEKQEEEPVAEGPAAEEAKVVDNVPEPQKVVVVPSPVASAAPAEKDDKAVPLVVPPGFAPRKFVPRPIGGRDGSASAGEGNQAGGGEDDKDGSSEAEVEIVGEEPTGLLAKGLAKARSLLPAGKKKSSRGSRDDSGKSSFKLVIISTVVLLVLILLISAGAIYKLGKSSGGQNPVFSNQAIANSESCAMGNGEVGIKKYQVTPRPETAGRRGYTDSLFSNEDMTTSPFDSTVSYYAVIEGSNYIVAIDAGKYVYFPVSGFVNDPVFECVDPAGITFLTGATTTPRTRVDVTYKLNFKHWSGWLVSFAMLCVFGFAGISLFMSGGGLIDVFLYLLAILLLSIFTSVSSAPGWAFGLFYVAISICSILFGSKEDLKQLNKQYEADTQFKVPNSVKPIFDALSKGYSIVGSYDWSKNALTHTLFIFIGAVSISASPLYKVFGNHVWAIVAGGLLIIVSFGLEAARRGMAGDWGAFAIGLVGFADFPLFILMFGNNPLSFSDWPPTAVAVGISWLLLFLAFIGNVILQAYSERNELARDRMADGMLMFSGMKLFAILLWIYLYFI